MNRRRFGLAVAFLSLLFHFAGAAQAAWLGKLVLDPNLPAETQKNFERAFAAVDGLLGTYELTTTAPVTVVVTADTEGYIQALMSYTKVSRAEAEAKAISETVNLGVSSTQIPVVVIRWIPTRQLRSDGTSYVVNNPEDGFFSLPHEIFHQVQNTYRLRNIPVWLSEGPATMFQFLAIDRAGVKAFAEQVRTTERNVTRGAPLDSTQLATVVDYSVWQTLTLQKKPTYAMATLMTVQLLGKDGFPKLLRFYGLLRDGADVDTAFHTAFGVSMAEFANAMSAYIGYLRERG